MPDRTVVGRNVGTSLGDMVPEDAERLAVVSVGIGLLFQ